MIVVRPDLAKQAVESSRTTLEWPHYASFVYISSVDRLALACGWMHCDLLSLIRLDVEATTGQRFDFLDADAYLGFVEWEDDGSDTVRTTGGRPLPPTIETDLRIVILKY